MKHILLGAISALSLMAVVASAAPGDQPGSQSPAPNAGSGSAVTDTATIPYGAVTAEMTITAKGFVTAAAMSDMYEVEAGRIAQQRAQSPDVKALAARMIEAHTDTSRKLKAVIASSHVAVPVPAHLDDRRQALIADLRGAKAEDFDHLYLSQQEAAHAEAELVMRGYSQDGDTAAIKAFAAAALPAVQDHLQTIRKLESNGKPSS